MTEVQEVARRILRRASDAPAQAAGSLAVAAAAAVVPDEASWPRDPSLRLKCAAAAAWPLPRLAKLIDAIPPTQRAAALSTAECLLARIDPRGTWAMIVARLGREAAFQSSMLGLNTAAWLAPAEAGALFAEKIGTNRLFAQQLRADIDGRAAQAAQNLPPARDLPASEAAIRLAGAARSDVMRALTFADEALEFVQPEALQQALDLLANAAVAQGHADRIVNRALRHEFIVEQAAWTRAAALSGILVEDALAQHVERLQPRVTDELDPSDVETAALPLLVAMASGGLVRMVHGYAAAWRVSIPELVEAVFFAHSIPDPTLANVLEGCAELHAPAGAEIEIAWAPRQAAAQSLSEASADVIRLAKELPWRPVPGTLSAILRWEPPESRLNSPAGEGRTSTRGDPENRQAIYRG